jgi:hypothetical protein
MHVDFWITSAAAAPIVALAAVVAVGDSVSTVAVSASIRRTSPRGSRRRRKARKASCYGLALCLISLTNVLAQAWVLETALVNLWTGENSGPAVLAQAALYWGLLALIPAALLASAARRTTAGLARAARYRRLGPPTRRPERSGQCDMTLRTGGLDR